MHKSIIKVYYRIGTTPEWVEYFTGLIGTNDRTHWKKLPGILMLISAKCLKCSFSTVAYGEWKDGEIVADINIEKDFELVFDSINTETNSARLIGNQGATDVFLTVTPTGICFIEHTGIGNMNFTTIFFEKVSEFNNEFKAVHSRHITLLGGGAIPSQRYGTCKIWD